MTPREFIQAHGAPVDVEGRPVWTSSDWNAFVENNETELADAGLMAPQPGATFEVARSQDEIVARFQAAEHEDIFGWRQEVLLPRLDFEHARQVIASDRTEVAWNNAIAGVPDLESEARDYLAFAIGKIRHERGISAERSVIKLREFAWLMGRDGVVTAMDGAAYAPYGEPKVRRFADGMGWPWMDEAELKAARNAGGAR